MKAKEEVIYDFHTHTLLSDGQLMPVELIRRAYTNGHRAVAISDHVSASNMERVILETIRDCEIASQYMDIIALPAVEITHVPKDLISKLARSAKELGARIVIVHGETICEPVQPGTNYEALCSEHVDILAHPGLISEGEMKIARETNTFIELSARKGHCLTNGYVAKLAQKEGALLLVNSDAHTPGDLFVPQLPKRIALGAGLDEEAAEMVVFRNPRQFLRRLGY